MNHSFLHHVGEELRGAWILPEATRAPTSRRTKAFTAILQQHILTGHKTRTSGYTGPEEQTNVCHESSPREFSGRAPPLRIHDQIVLVTTSSRGRCEGPPRMTCCEKQVGCSVSLSFCPRESSENNFHTAHPEWMEYLDGGVLPSFNLFIFH